ncbi:MAG: transcriptional regulator [Tabrizicola sp.]|jgi:AcrR family transcriptional regulator|nr:transcriptional regulator [Tabrizicola sp.]
MPRTRTIPDDRVFAAVHALLTESGDKAVSFASVAEATGLAAPTLVQRYSSRDGMLKAARLANWAQRAATAEQAIAATSDKGPQALLKALAPISAIELAIDRRDAELLQCAEAWRATVEAALVMRLGSGPKAREAAALLFAAWQGQALWPATGDGGFRLKDAVKRLT